MDIFAHKKGGKDTHMGTTDVITKNYIRQNDVFADACNYLIYGGKAIIRPEELKEMDTAELGILFGNGVHNKGRKKPESVQKYRDVLKSAVVMQDGQAAYLIIGIENQTDIHCAMPVRNMIYDALQYGKQVDQTARRNQRNRRTRVQKKGEFLSGFYKEDKLIPVITFVIHFGAEEWDGPMSLKEMMDLQDEVLEEYIQDYRIYLIDLVKLTEEELGKFKSSLREVLMFMKYSKDEEKMDEFIRNNENMSRMDRMAAEVMKCIGKIPMEIEEGGEVNMCKAIDDMMEKRERKGRQEGIQKGIQKGIREGREKGIQEGKKAGQLEVLMELAMDGILSVKVAADKASMSVNDFEKQLEKVTSKG